MSSIESDVFCSPGKDYFSFNLKFLALLGLWRNDHWPKTYLAIYDVYAITLHILPMISTVMAIIGAYEKRDDFADFLANLDKQIAALNFISKYIIFALKNKELKILITEIMDSGDKITKKCVKQMTLHVVVVTCLTTFVFTAFTVTSLLNGELSIDVWFPIDPFKNMMNLLLTTEIVTIMFAPCVLRGNAMQGIICSIIMYLSEQLVELQERIRNFQYSKGNELYVKEQFKKIIIKHIRLMRYSITMNDLFKEYFLIQNLAITLELCLNAVMITVVGFKEKKLLISFISFLCVALLNAYIYCYLGHELIIQSEGIARAAYDSSWTSWPVGLQKDLLIVMRVAQTPFSLSAGGLVNMSMQTFGQALYNGYSIFAVLADAVD